MLAAVGIEQIDDGLLRTRGADVDIAFRMRGAGPAVVLLHGTSANHAVWQPVGDGLENHATVIALDQRGHGRSDKPPTGYTGRDFAGDVVTVLDALGIDHAVVAGHSLGGRNAWLVGALYPDRVTGVVVVDYTPYVESAVLDELEVRVAGGFRSFSSTAEIESYLRDRYAKILPGAVERRAHWGYRPRADGSLVPYADPEAMRQLIDGFRTPWTEEFRTVRAPMVHLRGAESRIVSEAAWHAAIEDRPGDRWVVVERADHYIPEEFPDRLTAELDRVLGLPITKGLVMPLFIDKLAVSSPDFGNHERIPLRFTADEENLVPALEISGAPEGTVEFALIVNDPDAPLPHGFTHWVVYGIPADATSVDVEAPGVRIGPNGGGEAAWYGPQPPFGHGDHHYFFTLYALGTAVEGAPTREEFLAEYADSIIEQARYVGLFSRE